MGGGWATTRSACFGSGRWALMPNSFFLYRPTTPSLEIWSNSFCKCLYLFCFLLEEKIKWCLAFKGIFIVQNHNNCNDQNEKKCLSKIAENMSEYRSTTCHKDLKMGTYHTHPQGPALAPINPVHQAQSSVLKPCSSLSETACKTPPVNVRPALLWIHEGLQPNALGHATVIAVLQQP
jgi:hypothetical protein